MATTQQQQAKTLADQIIAAQRKALEAQRQEEARLAQQRANAAQQAYGAAAQYAQPIAGQVQDTYAGAAGRTAAFADLFSDDARQKIEAATAEANRILQRNNAPQQLASQAGPAGDVLAGLGGVIPATALEREGAAFTSAASQLPATLRGAGVQSGLSFLRQGEEAQRPYGQALRDLEAQRPKTQFDILQSLLESERGDRALDIQEDYLTNATTKLGADLTGTYVGADGKVYPTAAARNAANAAKTKKQTARQKSVAKRNDETVKTIDDLTESVRARLGGTERKEIGREPVRGPDARVPDPNGGADLVTPQWYTVAGGLTADPNDPNILSKPVYETVPIAKPDYDRLHKELTNRLRRKLSRFGYKKPFFVQAADEILGDFYEVVGGQAPSPTVPGKRGIPDSK